jgi:hypothetical protein
MDAGIEDIFTYSENEYLAAGQEDEIEDSEMQLSVEQHLETNNGTLAAVLAHSHSRVLNLEISVLSSTAGATSLQKQNPVSLSGAGCQ